ncbi:hypothetical protein LR48_Vigan07g075600 [Vigna angularis]|uniref:Transposase (putative) gypsy type domain-containing protein n=1 Tax=Phaseolus angularis TaxID=3914 RepID=A0A0L9UWW0_PHAAN|nr:hypothetical protein LR48_Vigan07g075600 [Vigna angularis]
MEEKGQSSGRELPEPSSAAESPDITTVPCGENAFCYGNVGSEGPEACGTSPARDGDYDWAAREVGEFSSLFRSRAVLADWVENSCILRTLGYNACVRLVACREDERVFHGRENSSREFFYCYAPPFYDLYLRMPFTTFQMDVLRTLNVVSSQLHPNGWGYMQAFVVLCRALVIRLTVALFLYFFRCRPTAKRGWVSLISEPGNALQELYLQSYRGFKNKFFKVSILDSGRRHFFYGEGNPKFPLYWTKEPLKFTSWAEDKMTIEELEALNVLTALPRPFSSRRLVNCLEHDDADSRVFEIMGRKGSGRNWFQAIDNERAEVVISVSADETMAVEEQLLVRKRKGKVVDTSGAVSKKRKDMVDETARPLPLGVWDPSFTLGHKVDLNLDDSEKKVVENMTEQQIADAMLEMTTRAQMLAWHMAYASDRGMVRVELEKARTQLKELIEAHAECDSKQKRSEQLVREAEVLLTEARNDALTFKKERVQVSCELEQAKKAVAALIKERDDWRAETLESKELVEELKGAIMIEHTRGFRKALRQVGHLLDVSTEGVEFDVRKDVYEGQLKPLSEIPEDAFMEAEEGEEVVASDGPEEAVAVDEPAVEAVGDVTGDTPNIVID